MNIVKIWLVTFSNGEEWHICGEFDDVSNVCLNYWLGMEVKRSFTIKYLRWV